MQTYEALATRIDLNGLCDLLEMRHARESWAHADMFEDDYQRERAAEQRAMQQAANPSPRKPRRSRYR